MTSLTSLQSPIRVMIVDDSAIIRGLLLRVLNEVPDIEVVGSAFNGVMAIEQIKRLEVDIILLDIEMPEMDGLTALPELLKLSPHSRIIIVSTLTLHNAEIGLRALALGASDYIAKPSSRKDESEINRFYAELINKIKALSPHKVTEKIPTKNKPASISPSKTYTIKYPSLPVRALAIGSSTGGPQALDVVFKSLATKFPKVPVFITQHMPPAFTTILAQHISRLTNCPCAEGKEGDVVVSGSIYVAPGDYHMVPHRQGDKIVISINKNPPVNFCRPAVDPMLQALIGIYGSHLLGVILTGMGSDGLGGARELVKAGGTVIAQDEATSVVWGMPRAVAENGLCSAVLPLNDIGPYILKACL